MQTAIRRFLNYLHVERNSSALTVKSYADDLSHIVEFLQEQTGSIPEPGHIEGGHSEKLRVLAARMWLRQNDSGSATGLPSEFFSLLQSGRHLRSESGKATPYSPHWSQTPALSHDRTDRDTADGTAGQSARGYS